VVLAPQCVYVQVRSSGASECLFPIAETQNGRFFAPDCLRAIGSSNRLRPPSVDAAGSDIGDYVNPRQAAGRRADPKKGLAGTNFLCWISPVDPPIAGIDRSRRRRSERPGVPAAPAAARDASADVDEASDPAAGVTSAGPRAGFSAGTIAGLQAAAGPSTASAVTY